MTIQPNEEGWSFSGELQQDQFCFVHKDGTRIFYGKSNISTTDTLFVGTKEECEAEMLKLEIPLVYRLVTNNSNIVFFGPKIDSDIYNGNEFLGTKEECEAEIVKIINTQTFDQTKYKLIYDNDYVILYFGIEENAPQIDGQQFLGLKEECEVEIIRLNLTYKKRENIIQQEVIQETSTEVTTAEEPVQNDIITDTTAETISLSSQEATVVEENTTPENWLSKTVGFFKGLFGG